jgi:hypothetical protein
MCRLICFKIEAQSSRVVRRNNRKWLERESVSKFSGYPPFPTPEVKPGGGVPRAVALPNEAMTRHSVEMNGSVTVFQHVRNNRYFTSQTASPI